MFVICIQVVLCFGRGQTPRENGLGYRICFLFAFNISLHYIWSIFAVLSCSQDNQQNFALEYSLLREIPITYLFSHFFHCMHQLYLYTTDYHIITELGVLCEGANKLSCSVVSSLD